YYIGFQQAIVITFIPSDTPTPTRVSTRTPTPTWTATSTATTPPTPSATRTPTIPPTSTPVYYVVQPGDALVTIAARFGVTVEAIMNANGLTDAQLIRAGTRLLIPGASIPQPSPTRK